MQMIAHSDCWNTLSLKNVQDTMARITRDTLYLTRNFWITCKQSANIINISTLFNFSEDHFGIARFSISVAQFSLQYFVAKTICVSGAPWPAREGKSVYTFTILGVKNV